MTHPTDDELEAMAKYHDWRNAEIDAILAALDPAPDHAEWDAAIEAAAEVADQHLEYVQPHCPDETHPQDLVAHGYGNAAMNIAHSLRTLKKGQTND